MNSTLDTKESSSHAIEFLKKNDIQLVDLRFTDTFGSWQHITIPVNKCQQNLFQEGLGFDGSSIRGFQSIDQSDMLLIPDPGSVFIDYFAQHPTAAFICNVIDPITQLPYDKDPREIAAKAEKYLIETQIADTACFGPEAEFFLFDKIRYESSPKGSFYEIDSEEAHWNSGYHGAIGLTMQPKAGYSPCAPTDRLNNLRSEMVMKLQDMGVEVEMHHHEVGAAGQCEIDLKYNSLKKMADKLQIYKYVVKNAAIEHGLVATFMPKPIFGDNGSGMHLHTSLWKQGENLMYDEKGYGGLSDLARWYIGGLLKHAPALLAFCAPTTNSYRRLVPGYEAPINLVYSLRNRSACIRIPMYAFTKESKRIEFRAPDPSANPYFAFATCLMAGIDGIQNKIEPPKPVETDMYHLSKEELQDIQQTPCSLRETLEALRKDHDFLLKGNVFTKEVINNYIAHKLELECDAVDLRPHPHEFYLYADC